MLVADGSRDPPRRGLELKKRSAKRGAQEGDGTGVNATGRFQDHLNQIAKDTDSLLDQLLGADPVKLELGRPQRLLEAMRYASLGAGKRFRPFLTVESAALFGVARQRALAVR